jgi:hypothetical protein
MPLTMSRRRTTVWNGYDSSVFSEPLQPLVLIVVRARSAAHHHLLHHGGREPEHGQRGDVARRVLVEPKLMGALGELVEQDVEV